MDEEEAWDKITRLTNKAHVSSGDKREICSLMKWLPEEKRSWIREGLFLFDTALPDADTEDS